MYLTLLELHRSAQCHNQALPIYYHTDTLRLTTPPANPRSAQQVTYLTSPLSLSFSLISRVGLGQETAVAMCPRAYASGERISITRWCSYRGRLNRSSGLTVRRMLAPSHGELQGTRPGVAMYSIEIYRVHRGCGCTLRTICKPKGTHAPPALLPRDASSSFTQLDPLMKANKSQQS